MFVPVALVRSAAGSVVPIIGLTHNEAEIIPPIAGELAFATMSKVAPGVYSVGRYVVTLPVPAVFRMPN